MRDVSANFFSLRRFGIIFLPKRPPPCFCRNVFCRNVRNSWKQTATETLELKVVKTWNEIIFKPHVAKHLLYFWVAVNRSNFCGQKDRGRTFWSNCRDRMESGRILSYLLYGSVASLDSPSSIIEAWPYGMSLRFAPAFRALGVCEHSWLRYNNRLYNINCTKCRVSFLYEMSGFVFVRNVWFWFLYAMSCVRNVVCTNCRAPKTFASLG